MFPDVLSGASTPSKTGGLDPKKNEMTLVLLYTNDNNTVFHINFFFCIVLHVFVPHQKAKRQH